MFSKCFPCFKKTPKRQIISYCPFCKRYFTDKKHYKKHMKKEHNKIIL